MQIIQPHYHGIARTAQDYERMAMSGVVAVAEPAFWDTMFKKPSVNAEQMRFSCLILKIMTSQILKIVLLLLESVHT